MKKNLFLNAALLGVFIFSSFGPARATSDEWINTGTDMNTASSWSSNIIPGTGDTLFLNGVAVTNPNLSSSLTATELIFSGAGGGYTLSTSSGQTLSLTNTGQTTSNAILDYSTGLNTISGNLVLAGSATEYFNEMSLASSLTISGNISGAQGLEFGGGGLGTLTLSGTNSMASFTEADSGGLVNINSAGALGSGTATFSVANTAVYLGNTSGGAVTVSNATTFAGNTYLSYTSANNLTFNGGLTLTSGEPFYVNGAGNLILSGGIASATSTLKKDGTGTLVLGGTNNYTGATTVNLGSLVLDNSQGGTLPSTNTLTLAGGNFTYLGVGGSGSSSQTLGNPTFNAGGDSITVNNNGSSGTTTLTLGNTWTNSHSIVNINISSSGSTLTSSPTLTNSILPYATVTDSGGTGFATVTAGNVARYTGAIALPASGTTGTVNYVENTVGTLQLTNTESVNSLQIDTTTAGASGTLDFHGFSLGASGTMGLLITGTNNFSFTNSSGTAGGINNTVDLIQDSTGTVTIGSNISLGAGNFVMGGTGTVTISSTITGATNTYLNGGTLNITGILSSTGATTTITNGTLNLQNTTAAPITTGTVSVLGSGTLTEVSGTANNIGGTAALTVNGAAATVDLYNNSYSGATTLTQGTVSLSSATAFGTSTVAFNGTEAGLNISATSDLTTANGGTEIANTYTLGASKIYNTFSGSHSIELSGSGSITSSQVVVNDISGGKSLILSGGFSIAATDTLRFEGTGNTIISGNIAATTGTLTDYNTGTLMLSGTNSYSGPTQVSAGSLELNSSGALSGTSLLDLSGGVVGLGTGNSSFTRALGNTAGTAEVEWVPTGTGGGSGGFAAYGANATVNLGGASAQVTWGTTQFFVGQGYDLIFGATDATNTVNFQNPLALNSQVRTVEVDGPSSIIEGQLSGVVSGTGISGLNKTGTGTLELSNTNTYAGKTIVSAGMLLVANSSGSGTGSGALTVARGAGIGGSGSSIGSIFTIGGSGSGTSTVQVGNGTDATSSLTLQASGASTIANANLTFNLDSTSTNSNQLAVGGTGITFGTGTTTLTLSLLNSGTISNNTIYTLVAGTGGTASGTGQYSGFTISGPNNEITGLTLQYASPSVALQYANSYLFLVNNPGGSDDIELDVLATIPEPSTWAMMISGFALLVFIQIRRRKSI